MNLIVVVAVGMDALRLYFQWKIFLALWMMATAEWSQAAAMVSSLLVLLDFFQPIDDWKYPFFFCERSHTRKDYIEENVSEYIKTVGYFHANAELYKMKKIIIIIHHHTV